MRRLLLPLLFAPLFSVPAFGWGCEGHEIVALIASAHLTPAISAAVDDLLRQNPADPALTRFCKDRPNDLLADAATWPDDVKSREKTGTWHYVDIPRTAMTVTAVDPWCPPIGPSVGGKDRPGCILNALALELGILGDKSAPSADRAAALRYVVHFLGDIHQPLHDSDNNDQGGNCTAMQFFEEAKPVNLHSVWDYKLLERRMEMTKLTQTTYAADLDKRFAAKFATLAAAKVNDSVAWSWETHFLSESVTYGNLVPAIPVETPDSHSVCAAERDKVTALHIEIGETYFAKAMPVIDEQLATAGFRLARLLNDTLR